MGTSDPRSADAQAGGQGDRAASPGVVAVIPCFDHPLTIGAMVDAVRRHGLPAIVVDDGSSTACARVLDELAITQRGTMELLRLSSNQGKGGAMMAGLRKAQARGFTHALQIDADGQHDVADIPKFLRVSAQNPHAVIYGQPRYDESVPKRRLYARYLTHVWVWINTLSFDISDSMCGFRVYPLSSVVRLIDRAKLGRRMEFDSEVLVRLHWQGVLLLGLATKVSYPADGISHFKRCLDNALISHMHARLFAGMLLRLPYLLWRKLAW